MTLKGTFGQGFLFRQKVSELCSGWITATVRIWVRGPGARQLKVGPGLTSGFPTETLKFKRHAFPFLNLWLQSFSHHSPSNHQESSSWSLFSFGIRWFRSPSPWHQRQWWAHLAKGYCFINFTRPQRPKSGLRRAETRNSQGSHRKSVFISADG